MQARWMTIGILSLVVVLSATALFQSQGLPVGTEAPDFTLETLDGKTVKLSELRGKPVFLDFWATWCGPCRRALPHTQEFAKKYGNDAHILAVNLREDKETVRAFMEKHNFTFTVPMDTKGEVASRYRVRGIPHFVVIDAKGVVQFVQVGFGGGIEKKLEEVLTKAIEESRQSVNAR